MTEQEINDFNRRCAEFLGWKIVDGIITYIPEENEFQHEVGYSANGFLQFHSDWNWIMEILDKVALLDFGWKVTSKYVNIYSHTGDPRGEFDCKHKINCPENVMLDTVRTINQFLIWYNNVNTNK